MFCPRCNAQSVTDDEFCAQCGLDLRTVSTYCPACGARSVSGDAFCAACGKRLVEDGLDDLQTRVKIAASERTAGISKAEGTALRHSLVGEIASSHEYNSLSPIAALGPADKKASKVAIPVAGDILDAILQPSKAFYFTATAGDRLYQEILLVKGPVYCRWTDAEGTVVISREKGPRDFIDHIYGEISREMAGGEKSIAILTREQILILKAVSSLGRTLAFTKIKSEFTSYEHLKHLLNTDDGLKGRLHDLARDGMVRIRGSGNPIITLQARGVEVVNALENYDAFSTLQVLTEGIDDFPSVYLTLSEGRLFMMSNPKNGDDVVVRTLDKAGLRSVLNWMWTASLTP
jgi:hypothetical protein